MGLPLCPYEYREMKVREHRGSLDRSMGTMVEIEPTAEALVAWINGTIGPYLPKDVVPEDISYRYQMFDARIGWESYLIHVAGFGVCGMLDGPPPTFPGARLFELKATHGLPLDAAIDRIINKHRTAISWDGFLTQARANGWYDFQTMDVITQALEDALIDREMRLGIITRLKLYILKNPMELTK